MHPYSNSLLSAIALPAPLFEKQRKRISYNPIAEHDYSQQQPYMQEVAPGHFIYCNDAELEKYKQEIAEIDAQSAKEETIAAKAAEKPTAKPSKTTKKTAEKTSAKTVKKTKKD